MTDASGRETAAFHIPAEADLQACTCGNGLSGTGFGNGLRGRAFGNGLSGTTRGTDFRKRYAGNRPAGLIPSAEKGFCRISKYIYLCNEMITQDDIFGITDDLAIGAIEAIKEKGLNIPEDIAIVGFSNTKRSRYMNPTVSSINQFPEKIGRAAAELLFDQILNSKHAQIKKEIINCELIVRESSDRRCRHDRC